MSNSPLKQHPSGLAMPWEGKTKKSGKKGYFTGTTSPRAAARHRTRHSVPPTTTLAPLKVLHGQGLNLPWILQQQASKHQDFHSVKVWKTQLNSSLLLSSFTLPCFSDFTDVCLLFKRSLTFFAKQAVESALYTHIPSKYHSSCFSPVKFLNHSGNKPASRAYTIAVIPTTVWLVEVTCFASHAAGWNVHTCMKHYN